MKMKCIGILDMEIEKICFVVNPISGINRNPQKIVNHIHQIFKPSKINYKIVYTDKPGDGTALASQCIDEGFELVVGAGGDGTINEIGRGLVNSDVALGVIPCGSGNGFARNFKIPLNQERAIKILQSPRIVMSDTATINDHYFFNVAGLGLDAKISQSFEEFGTRGPLPYFLIGTRAFIIFQPEPLKLVMNDQELTLSPLVLTIANGAEYGNGAVIAPGAQPDDGFLDVIILDQMPLWKAVPNLYRLFNGTIDQMEGFRSYRVKSLKIFRNSQGVIQTDGNPHLEKAELQIDIHPKSLRVATGFDFTPCKSS